MLLDPVAAGKLNTGRLGKILSQKMAGTGLDRLTILDHGLNAQGADRSREPLIGRLLARQNRDSQMLTDKSFIHTQHLLRFSNGFLLGLVSRMAFLPEKFCRPQKQARTHFPTDNIGPLIDQNGQITITLHPAGIGRANNRLRRRPHHQRLCQQCRRRRPQLSVRSSLQTMVGHHRTFLGKTLDVRRFLLEITQRNKQREIRILVARLLKQTVQLTLDILPQAVTPWLNHHAAANF